MTAVEKFVRDMSEISLPKTFNPYSDICPECDKADADEIRRENLRAALNAALKLNVRTVWIARDLGYRGGRRTGLALTDEGHLESYSEILDGARFQKSTHGPVVSERTASVIWRMAQRINEPVFMWNVFPLHPHEEGVPFSNRCHTASERNALKWVLTEVLTILKPSRIYSIGRDAQSCLSSAGHSAVAFRHPSYGGQNEFIRQVEAEYNVYAAASEEEAQLSLI